MSLTSEESRWEVARARIAYLGAVPASFSSLIRKLRADMQAQPAVLSNVAKYELNRLLKGPSLLTPLTYAALEFHKDKLDNVANLPSKLMEVFSLEELSSLIGAIYFTRQVKKRCSEEEWKFIQEPLILYSTLAGHLGGLAPTLGFERAINTVVFTILGMALFQSSNAKEYANYRRILKKSGTYYNISEEIKSFGCSANEMCSLLSQTVAISSSLSSEFLSGLEAEEGKRPSTSVHALNVWLHSLAKNSTAPQIPMDAKWYPDKSKVELIENMAKRVNAGNSPYAAWILKEAADFEAIKSELSKLKGGDLGADVEIAEESGDTEEIFEEGAVINLSPSLLLAYSKQLSFLGLTAAVIIPFSFQPQGTQQIYTNLCVAAVPAVKNHKYRSALSYTIPNKQKGGIEFLVGL